jgi:hypothetical protein
MRILRYRPIEIAIFTPLSMLLLGGTEVSSCGNQNLKSSRELSSISIQAVTTSFWKLLPQK